MASPIDQVVHDIENLFGDIYGADEVQVWLTTPQSVLDGGRPIDLIESGQSDAVIRAVHEILDGILT